MVLASHHSDLSSQDRHLGPRPRGPWFGREFCEQGTPWRQPPPLPAACCSRSAAVPRTRAAAARAAAPAAGPTGPTASSVAAGGGINALVAAAKKEGTLNVITLPANWANYGTIMKDFTAKYGIKINDANPDGSSQDELNAVNQLKGQDRAPDVLDMGTAFAVKGAQQGILAPYKVATWASIPADAKASDGTWFADYGGYVAIGYNADKVKTPPTSFADLLKPEYKNQVAINGNPTQASAAFSAVFASAGPTAARWTTSRPASPTSRSCTPSATSCRSRPARPWRAARPRSSSGGTTCSRPRSGRASRA